MRSNFTFSLFLCTADLMHGRGVHSVLYWVARPIPLSQPAFQFAHAFFAMLRLPTTTSEEVRFACVLDEVHVQITCFNTRNTCWAHRPTAFFVSNLAVGGCIRRSSSGRMQAYAVATRSLQAHCTTVANVSHKTPVLPTMLTKGLTDLPNNSTIPELIARELDLTKGVEVCSPYATFLCLVLCCTRSMFPLRSLYFFLFFFFFGLCIFALGSAPLNLSPPVSLLRRLYLAGRTCACSRRTRSCACS